MDKKNTDKFIYSYTTISNIIGFLEKNELNSLKAIMKKKFNISVVCLLQLHEIDKELVISGSCDSTMKVWKIERDQCIRTLTGHKSSVKCMIWIKYINKFYIMSGSEDTTLKIWNIDTGKCISTIVGHKGPINALVYLSDIDKDMAASASSDNHVKIWSINNGKCLKTLNGHNDSVCNMLYHKAASGSLLLSFSKDETMKVWNVQDKEFNTNSNKNIPTGPINGAISFGNNKILTCGDDFTVKIWCLIKWEKVKTFNEHSGAVKCILSLDDIEVGLFATGSEDKTIRIWNLKFKDERADVIINTISVVTCFPFSMVHLKYYEYKTLATGNNDGSIQLIKI